VPRTTLPVVTSLLITKAGVVRVNQMQRKHRQEPPQAISGTKEDNVGGRYEFEWWDDDHQPHWQHSGKGQAHLRVSTHIDRKWLSFDAIETSLAPDGRSKRTMVTLDEQAAAKLYAWLADKFDKDRLARLLDILP
jgi:hypothetical protein